MTSAKDLVPPGYGFNPTEEEIANYFLPHKIRGNHSQVSAIAEIDNILKYKPWELPGLAKKPSSKHQWFFFSPRNSERCKRKTKAGSWNVTGQKYELKNRVNQLIIKRYLVFYTGRESKAVRTNWKIHEYYLKPSCSNERGYVVHRLFQDQKSPKKNVNSAVDEGEPSHDSTSEVENPLSDSSFPVTDQDLQFMAELNDSNVNLQHTNGVTGDHTGSLSQYSGRMQISPGDSSPSESSGSKPVEDNGDSEAIKTLLACFAAVGNDSLQDWLFEHVPAFFSQTRK